MEAGRHRRSALRPRRAAAGAHARGGAGAPPLLGRGRGLLRLRRDARDRASPGRPARRPRAPRRALPVHRRGARDRQPPRPRHGDRGGPGGGGRERGGAARRVRRRGARASTRSWRELADTQRTGAAATWPPSRSGIRRSTRPCGGRTTRRGVERIREYIQAGDAFQVVLSQRLGVRLDASPFELYRALRTLNPSPYLYFLELDGMALVGSSPEVLVRVEDGVVTVRPIAGTRPRGAGPEEDRALADDLRADEKELAEHRMLVDLGRNDVGPGGGVRLRDRAGPHGRRALLARDAPRQPGRGAAARPACSALDVFRACFPAGTVSARRRSAPWRSSTSWSRCAGARTLARSATSATAAAAWTRRSLSAPCS